MKFEDVKIGMKVVPIRYSDYNISEDQFEKFVNKEGRSEWTDTYSDCRQLHSLQSFKKFGYAVIKDEEIISGGEKSFLLGREDTSNTWGNWYKARDFNPYMPPIEKGQYLLGL